MSPLPLLSLSLFLSLLSSLFPARNSIGILLRWKICKKKKKNSREYDTSIYFYIPIFVLQYWKRWKEKNVRKKN